MGYTRVWSEAIPAGTDAASSIDDSMRALRVDMRERMSDLVVSWSADPIVPQDRILGNAVGKTLILPGSVFSANDPGGFAVSRSVSAGVVKIYDNYSMAAVPVPAGCTITGVDIIIRVDNFGPTTITLNRRTYDVANLLTTLATGTKAVANGVYALVALAGGGLPHLVLDGNIYTIEVAPAGSAQNFIKGARVTYNTPDCRFTR